jgi:hypothetical protein
MKRGSSIPLRLVLLITLTILTAGPVLAETVLGPVRCGTKLVQVGDTKDQILAIEPGSDGGVEVWYYDRGSGRFSGYLRFSGPKLMSIERSD